MTRIAPSMTAAPESIVAISISWPGASTKLMARWNSAFLPHSAHSWDVQKHFGSEQSGHLKMAKSA